MRRAIPHILVGLMAASPALAESSADRIRDLYHAVAPDVVKASPGVDIRRHIEMMRERVQDEPEGFASPDLDMDVVLRESGPEDVLMNPRVLEAIAMMPADRAAQVLRMIEDHRAGLDPLQDVPSLSLSSPEDVPESLALRGWRLDRDAGGAPFLEKGGDSASRIMLVPSMILADFGRVMSIQDDAEGFRVTLESGDVLEGEVARTQDVPDPAEYDMDEDLAGSEGAVSATEPSATAIASTPRPRSRPTPPLVTQGAVEEEAAPPASSLRPRPRPAGLGEKT